ncbi:multidrug resistance protein [Streptomyces sp. NBRC 110611]|uniref:hypothetical protein n=1 Tax=Streptomyces sp. NBRC 110611 TaxID=1621259 RepID=UPI00082B3020|nr:hypothetical protein [Streptomyces sp. NBRC 110611]GAU66685.1 multidrug resistance protein [Streptomyces sp. NBRC 110611]
MITVRLHEDRRHVLLEGHDIAEVVAQIIATVYAADPQGVADMLEKIATRRRTYDGLANLEEARDIPERIIDGAAAALDAALETFMDSLPSIDFAMSERDARLLAADLYHHAAQSTTARIRERAAR